MLKEYLERSLLMGIGVLSLTREKAQALAEEMAQQGKATQGEVKSLTEGLVKRGEEERNALRKVVREEFDASLREMRLATASDIKTLQAEIEKLKAQLAAGNETSEVKECKE